MTGSTAVHMGEWTAIFMMIREEFSPTWEIGDAWLKQAAHLIAQHGNGKDCVKGLRERNENSTIGGALGLSTLSALSRIFMIR